MCTLLQELDRIGEEQSLVIAVGYMLRYNPAINAAQALLKEVCPLALVSCHEQTCVVLFR